MKTFSSTVALGLLLCAFGIGNARADDALRRIQQSLRDQGFYYGAIDGTPGDETTQAVRRYQIRNGLAVSGQLNPETAASIDRTGAAAKSNGTGSGGTGKITGGNSRPGNNVAGADDDRSYAQGGGTASASRPTPAPPPRSTPPPLARSAPSDENDDAPAPRAPVRRPDLRVAPPADDDEAPAAALPRRGIAPSATLMDLFGGTPYEFAPPPVQADTLHRAQSILAREGFYDGETNGRPNPVTLEALSNFQGVHHLRRTGRLDADTLARMHLLPARPVGAPRGTDNDAPRGPAPVYEGRLAE